MNYYLFQNDEPKGPFTLGQLRSMWHAGSITGETHYCEVGSDQWLRLKLLIDQLEPLPKPLPPQPLHPQSAPEEYDRLKREAKEWEEKDERETHVMELRRELQRRGESWLSCPRCESPATGTRGCLGILFFPISLLIMKPTYTCGVCGFRFKQ